MALRVARGLFRLWLVFSVLWIAGVAIHAWWTFPADEFVLRSDLPDAPWVAQTPGPAARSGPPPGYVIDPPSTQLPATSTKRGDGWDVVCTTRPPSDVCEPADPAQTPQKFDPSKPYTIVKSKERRAAVYFASPLALAPPTLTLVFGWAFVWAFRGFRAS
jgi:hypothetical protein